MQTNQRLSYHVATTIDGFIARHDDSYDCFLGEGPHVDDFIATLQTYGTAVMGRRTYEGGLRLGVTNPFPWLRTIVFSKSLEAGLEPNVEISRDDAVEHVRVLKAEPGAGIWLCGGAKLASTLFQAGLIDTLIVKLNPLILGDGIPLVASLPTHIPLTLSTQKTYDNGVMLLTYLVA